MGKKTIGLITLHNSPNYGSCLQTYATQMVFAALGDSCTVIDYYRYDAIPGHEVDRALNGQLAKKLPIFKIPGMKELAKIPVKRMVERRSKPLNEFRSQYLNLSSRKYYSFDELCGDVPKADIYCTGSDQVWNSTWNQGFERAFYLEFAPKGTKRIAYAASIGKSSIEDWEAPLMRDALSKYEAISVREREAADLLESIGVKGAVPVIDPTLMLKKGDWAKISDEWNDDESYILVYQLNRNAQFDKYVQDISRLTGMKVYRIAYGVHERRKGEKAVICPSLGRFLSMFLGAELVVTDSFHGTAFSVNLNKHFISINPGRFGGRIVNLLTMTGLDSRLLGDYRDTSLVKAPINFEEANSALDVERLRAMDFLRIATKGGVAK